MQRLKVEYSLSVGALDRVFKLNGEEENEIY